MPAVNTGTKQCSQRSSNSHVLIRSSSWDRVRRCEEETRFWINNPGLGTHLRSGTSGVVEFNNFTDQLSPPPPPPTATLYLVLYDVITNIKEISSTVFRMHGQRSLLSSLKRIPPFPSPALPFPLHYVWYNFASFRVFYARKRSL